MQAHDAAALAVEFCEDVHCIGAISRGHLSRTLLESTRDHAISKQQQPLLVPLCHLTDC